MTDAQQLTAFLAIVIGGLVLAYFFRGKKNHPADAPAAHIFLDLETLGIKQDAPILVIAAYAVDSLGNKIARNCWRIDPANATLYGESDPATVKWWSEQSDYAQELAFKQGPRLDLPEALAGLEAFIKPLADKYGDQCFVWGNAPTFDCSILRYAYEVIGRDVPWEFWQERDVRTMAWFGKWAGHDAKKLTEFSGEPHVALHDARHQARYTIDILNELGGR
ncbi:3'-5' exoribonuclease [Oceanospirillum phage vB_OsaM_PD0307]|nr:3'-5' exoribonuclease [Oceanospirillum phage vB_OsaM_PD0307]